MLLTVEQSSSRVSHTHKLLSAVHSISKTNCQQLSVNSAVVGNVVGERVLGKYSGGWCVGKIKRWMVCRENTAVDGVSGKYSGGWCVGKIQRWMVCRVERGTAEGTGR